MRSRMFFCSLIVAGMVAAATLIAGEARSASRKSAVTTFDRPTSVAGTIVKGRVLIVHEHEKMAQGGACTTIYQSDAGNRKGKELVSFACIPVERPLTEHLRVSCVSDPASSTDILKEYQFGHETEGHGVPQSR